jgi:PAS domain S-box-containing protein
MNSNRSPASDETWIPATFRSSTGSCTQRHGDRGQGGLIVLTNQQTNQLFGYANEELVGQKVEILVPARFRSKHPGHRADFLSEPRRRLRGVGLDRLGLQKDGTEFPVEISRSPVETPQGIVVVSAIRDVSKRKAVEDRFRALLESAPGAMVIVNEKGTIVLVNSRTEQLFGYERKELLGYSVETLLPERFHGRHLKHRSEFTAIRARDRWGPGWSCLDGAKTGGISGGNQPQSNSYGGWRAGEQRDP